MAQDYIQLADRTKLGADTKSVTVGGTAHNIERQQLVSVPGTSLAEQGVAYGEVLAAQLLNGAVADANVDGTAPAAFSYQVPASKVLLLDLVELVVRDTGAWTGALFGAAPALSEGIRVEVIESDGATVLLSLIPGGAAKSNADLLAVPGARAAMPFADTMQVELPAGAEGWPLVVSAGRYVRLTVADNLTGLDGLRASIRGRLA